MLYIVSLSTSLYVVSPKTIFILVRRCILRLYSCARSLWSHQYIRRQSTRVCFRGWCFRRRHQRFVVATPPQSSTRRKGVFNNNITENTDSPTQLVDTQQLNSRSRKENKTVENSETRKYARPRVFNKTRKEKKHIYFTCLSRKYIFWHFARTISSIRLPSKLATEQQQTDETWKADNRGGASGTLCTRYTTRPMWIEFPRNALRCVCTFCHPTWHSNYS